MKIKNLLLVCALFVTIQLNAQNDLGLMPFPQNVKNLEGKLLVAGHWSIYVSDILNPSIKVARDRFVKRFENATTKKITISEKLTASNIQITIINKAELGIESKEGYRIQIDTNIIIKASAEQGVIYALETLNQLLNVYKEGNGFPKVVIEDWPTYSWRGMMVDVARHFIPMEILRRNVDAMVAVKMNTLHLHISDDEGFRIESKKYPQLHLKGSNGEFYTQAEILDFVKYCKERGVEVYAEFDLPGHSQSWFAGYPELAAEKKGYSPGPRFTLQGDKPVNLMSLMQMMNTSPTPTLDVSAEAMYTFLDNLTKEMKPLFSKAFMHMGLDENNGVAWMKNPQIVSFMESKGMKTPHELQNYFSERFSKIIEKNGLTPIAWEEAFHKGLPKSILVQVWKPAFMGPSISLDSIAKNGNNSIVSRGFYLDVFMPAYYHYLNADFLNKKANNNLLGGEAAIWSELVDESNFESRVWPRAAVIAERFWSSHTLQDVDDMYNRMNLVSHKLSWDGLQHISRVNVHLDQMTNGKLNESEKLLLEVIAPVKGYKKIMGLMTKPASIQSASFRQLSDILPIDAAGKWEFRKQVKGYLQLPSEYNLGSINKTLKKWETLNEDISKFSSIPMIQKHADNLSLISKEILHYLHTKEELLKPTILKMIANARLPYNETELVVLDELEALISGKLKDLDMTLSVF